MKQKKILVTGGAGFIGSAFIRLADSLGIQVAVVDKLTYAGDYTRIKGLKNIRFYKNDIGDKKSIAGILSREKPEAIIHFAAETHVDRSILDSAVFVNTNIAGVQNLMEAARVTNIKKYIHISTDEVYGEIKRGSFSESHPLEPNSPYAASKASADLLVKSYIRTYNFPAIIVRPSNNYGPWQYPEKLIPVVIYKAFHNLTIPVYAKGFNIREWLYVEDCAQAILTVLLKGTLGETYNIGSGCEERNIDVVNEILSIMKKPRTLIEFVKDRPGHDWRYSLNFSKIKKLGWKPKINFSEGIARTVLWNLENRAWLEDKVSYLRSYWKKVYKKGAQ